MKLGGWIIMLSTLVIFLTMMGFETGLTSILDWAGVSIGPTEGTFIADIENSSFWDSVFGASGILIAIIGTAVGSVLVGLFGKGYDVSLVLAPFIVGVAGIFGSTFWAIIKLVMSYNQWWMTSIVGLIFSVLAVGFAVACVDYFGGR